MAYTNVTEENVHLCTGKPLPSDIKNIASALLNMDYQSAYESMYINY